MQSFHRVCTFAVIFAYMDQDALSASLLLNVSCSCAVLGYLFHWLCFGRGEDRSSKQKRLKKSDLRLLSALRQPNSRGVLGCGSFYESSASDVDCDH